MRALIWNGINDLRVETVPDPAIVNPKDVIVRTILSSVCGSDLHLLGGYVPSMQAGDIIGHEFLGEVVETGRAVETLKKGDRVTVISIIGCGGCEHCRRLEYNACDNSNPKPALTEMGFGQACAGIFGYSHAFGGYAGSHATYVRIPFAEVNCVVVPEGVTDEQAVFVSDAAPTGFFGADIADIAPGDIVAVWGCGGVGQMAIRSAYLLGASRVIAIDRFPERLAMAEQKGGAEVINYETVDVHAALMDMTGGRGPDRCIDAVGMEAHGVDPGYLVDMVKQQVMISTDRASALRQAIMACRKGGTVSVVGVYGFTDTFPMGAIVNKALTLRSGQQPGQRYARRLFDHILKGELDTSYLMTHPMPLEQAPEGYAAFKNKTDKCVRAVFRP
jgi:threonine dehydrogenase-like Zn-dependent dehydrogenase